MADAGPWFSSDVLPPLRTAVRCLWAGRVFEATRLVHPKKKRILWATLRDGEMEYLPPKGRSRIWGEHPALWQPLNLAAWTHPLPEPVTSTLPHWPPPQAKASIMEGARNPLWWRDLSQLSYSPQGAVSQREAEGRVMRALNTNWRIQMERPREQTNADIIARLAEEKLVLADLLDEPLRHDWRPPFEPQGADYDDFLIAMGWFTALNPSELWHKRRRLGDMNRAQTVLIYRAMDPPASWGFIGAKWGISPEGARQTYQSSLRKLERAANGRPVFTHVRVTNPILKVREANKRYATQDAP